MAEQTRFIYEKDEETGAWLLVDFSPYQCPEEDPEDYGICLEFPNREAVRSALRLAKSYVEKWGNIDFRAFPSDLDTPFPPQEETQPEEPVTETAVEAAVETVDTTPEPEAEKPATCPFCELPEHPGDCDPVSEGKVIGKEPEPVDPANYLPKYCPKCGHEDTVSKNVAGTAASNIEWACKGCGEYSNSLEFLKPKEEPVFRIPDCEDHSQKKEPYRSEVTVFNSEKMTYEAVLVYSGRTEPIATRRAVKAARELLRKDKEKMVPYYEVFLSEQNEEGEWVRGTRHTITRGTSDVLLTRSRKPKVPKATTTPKKAPSSRRQALNWLLELAAEQKDKVDRIKSAYDAGYFDFRKHVETKLSATAREERLRRWAPYERSYMDGWNAARAEEMENRKPITWLLQLAEEQARVKA